MLMMTIRNVTIVQDLSLALFPVSDNLHNLCASAYVSVKVTAEGRWESVGGSCAVSSVHLTVQSCLLQRLYTEK